MVNKTGQEREYCWILKVDEENCIVEFVKNKNRAYQGLNKNDVTKLIIDVLKIRHLRKSDKRGRNYKPLSKNAIHVLRTKKLGQW